jgi:sensor histidine kinase YesM
MAAISNLRIDKLLYPKNRIIAHFIFWLLYLGYFSIAFSSFRDNYIQSFVEVFVTLPVRMAATYFTLYWLITGFLDKEKYITFACLFIITAIGFGYLDRILLHLFYVPFYLPNYDYETFPLTSFSKALQRTTNVYTIVFAAAAIKLIKRNYQNEKIARELSREKLDAELKFLKSQIHPHFLFNTLNSLYALTLQKSNQSSEVVLKLSQFLDYMLYDCNVSQISLEKEIEQMQNLITLEKLRYGDRLDVDFNISGSIIAHKIPPLLMLPFIENAFKHGVSQHTENSFIYIDLKIKDQNLIFRVENSCVHSEVTEEADYTKGIGLKNVKRRLDLIYGPSGYELEVFKEEDSFTMVLKILLIAKNE